MSTVEHSARKPGFRIDTFRHFLKAREHDMSAHFSHNTQERDASVVVTVAPVPFVLVQGDDFGIFHVLRDATFTPEHWQRCHVVAAGG